MAKRGVTFKIKRDECILKDKLDLFNTFGSSLITSDAMWEQVYEACQAPLTYDNVETVNLSPVELKIIERLNAKNREE